MNVFIESTLGGSASGHAELQTSPTATVDSLIVAFCIDKGIRYRQQYVLKDHHNVLLDNTRTLNTCEIESGDVLYLTTRNEEQQVFGFSNWWVLCTVAAFIGVLGITVVSVVYAQYEEKPFGFGVVFDAGSTHTDMALYKWDSDKDNGTGEVVQVTTCTAKGSGIASFLSDPIKAGASLKPCLQTARKNIPKSQQKATKVYLGATAGMRILNATSPDKATEVMEAVAKALSDSGLDYQPGQALIISGLDEGLFGWITTNYLYNRLSMMPDYHEGTLGALDMGGASMQISFVPLSASPVTPNSSYVAVQLYGTKYDVFSRSYLCFGKKEVERRFKVELVKEQPLGQMFNISDPCANSGLVEPFTISELFDQLCTLKWDNTSIPNNTNITFYGKGDPPKCQQKISELLNTKRCHDNSYDNCFDASDLPQHNANFVAFSAYKYVMDFFNMTNPVSLEEFRRKVEAFCRKPWEEIKNISYNPPVPLVYLTEYCFDGMYVIEVLKAFNFTTEESWHQLEFKAKVRDVDLGWALGFMTNATNAIPAESNERTLGTAVFVILLILFVCFIVASIAFAYHAYQQGRRSKSYQRFSQYGAI